MRTQTIDAVADMWVIASEAGYDNAIASLRTASDMPGFLDDKDALMRAAKLLEDLQEACSAQGLLVNNAAARDAFFDTFLATMPRGMRRR